MDLVPVPRKTQAGGGFVGSGNSLEQQETSLETPGMEGVRTHTHTEAGKSPVQPNTQEVDELRRQVERCLEKKQ